MNFKKAGTPLLVGIVILLLAVLASRIQIGATANTVAIMKTTGMTCPTCASTITRSLEKIKGVAGAEVDLAGSMVIVGYDRQGAKPESLVKTVNDCGFASSLQQVLTVAQYREITGRALPQRRPATGCRGCGQGSGCAVGPNS
jgi:copper chaperone CopZ